MAAAGPHISIKGELIGHIAGFPITNSLLTTWAVLGVSFLLAYLFYHESLKKNKSYYYYAVTMILRMLHDLFSTVLHTNIRIFFPLLISFFFFIMLNNWSGLIPGVGTILIKQEMHAIAEKSEDTPIEEVAPIADGEHTDEFSVTKTEEVYEQPAQEEVHYIPLLRGGTADLNTTLALALISVAITQMFGFQFLGAKTHLGKYFNVKSPILLFVGILELILEFARILSFSFRLFGNIFAGEVLLTVVPFLLPLVFSFVSSPMFIMEVFVGAVQAMVFTMLSAVFINMAVSHNH